MKFFLLVYFLVISTPSKALDCRVIQDLIDSASKLEASTHKTQTVVIPAGDYVCQKPIIISSSNLNIIGQHQEIPKNVTLDKSNIGAFNKVNIRVADHKNIPAIIIGGPATLKEDGKLVAGKLVTVIVDNKKKEIVVPLRVENISLSFINVDGNKSKQTQECWNGKGNGSGSIFDDGCTATGDSAIHNNGITIRGASKINISDVVLRNNMSGGMVTEKYCHDLTVNRMLSTQNRFDGFAGYQTNKSHILNSSLSGNDYAGASLDLDFDDNEFVNVDFNHNGAQGIFARYSKGDKFIDSQALNNGFQGVFLAANPEAAGPCPSNMLFKNMRIGGSGKKDTDLTRGYGFQINDVDCHEICLDGNGKIENNKLDDIVRMDKTSKKLIALKPNDLNCNLTDNPAVENH